MAFSWDNYQALILGATGLALTAAPALNRVRRRHRVRTRLKQDLELIEAADKVKLEGSGSKELRALVDVNLSELAAYEQQLRRRATSRRTWRRRAVEPFVIGFGGTLALASGIAVLLSANKTGWEQGLLGWGALGLSVVAAMSAFMSVRMARMADAAHTAAEVAEAAFRSHQAQLRLREEEEETQLDRDGGREVRDGG